MSSRTRQAQSPKAVLPALKSRQIHALWHFQSALFSFSFFLISGCVDGEILVGLRESQCSVSTHCPPLGESTLGPHDQTVIILCSVAPGGGKRERGASSNLAAKLIHQGIQPIAREIRRDPRPQGARWVIRRSFVPSHFWLDLDSTRSPSPRQLRCSKGILSRYEIQYQHLRRLPPGSVQSAYIPLEISLNYRTGAIAS